jgi:hypothetical protein
MVMRRVWTLAVMAFAAMALVLPAPAAAQQALNLSGRTQGELRQGDSALPSGELVDDYAFTGRAGQRVVIRMSSGALDPYLILSGPNGFQRDNDDVAQGSKDAVIDVTLPANGVYRVRATTYQAGERGAYALAVSDGAGTPQQATAPAAPAQSAGTIAAGQSINGTLAQGDATLSSGEFQDTYRLQGRRGQQYVIRLRASAFDPYLLVRGPNNLSQDNDDDETERGSRNSRIVVTMPSDGELRITATSYQAGDSGPYSISVEGPGGIVTATNGAIGNAAQPRGPTLPATPITVGATTNGTLASGDSTLRSGEFYDSYTFQGRRGQAVDIRLTSTAFDPYVMISGPNNFSVYNDDDAEGGQNNKNSRLLVTLPADGEYRVQATSYQSGESGAYRLSLGAATAGAAPAQGTPLVIGQTSRGALASADEAGNNGAVQDRYRFQGRRGQRVSIDMRSSAFDTMVALVAPSGAREQNDDAAQGQTNSLLETSLSEDGEYSVIATSYASGGLGAYELTLRTLAASGERSTAVSAAGPTATGGALQIGSTTSGRLAQGDATLQSGEFLDRYTFQGRRGQAITVDMASSDFDPYLIVNAPSGAQQDNDDAAQGSTSARVAWTLPEDGAYIVRATSYQANESGAYTLRLSAGGASGPSGPSGPIASGRRGKVYALMVGISDYAGTASNLAYTADDARKMAETLRRQGVLASESIVLTDAQATPSAVRSAFARVAAAAGPNDMFLFFYSGHGSQQPARAGSGEPDNRDETIALIGGQIVDDEMAQMFRTVRAGVSILALDSCFSGGFARDVVSQPGVMGLFSSEEDLTSAVASKFQAGGYLSHFLRTGLGGEADQNRNKVVTAGEISSYLRQQFASQAQGIDAQTAEGQRNYQFLVVERGGVKIDDAVLHLP